MKCGCSADDDEQSDEVREAHPDVGVGLDASQVLATTGRVDAQGVGGGISSYFLCLLRCLPEEQIRADRGPEHCDDDRKHVTVERNVWPKQADQNLLQRETHGED